MENIHSSYSEFQKDFPKISALREELGKEIHENSGPVAEPTRWLIKVSISAACNHTAALKTHIKKAQLAGITDEEIKHTLLLLIPTAGFPTFMKAYSVFKKM